jgi:Family of unknown function (DUF6527)
LSVLTHQFVEHIPEVLTLGVLYVCIPYATVVHTCCCGCGGEVVTPLSPTDWQLVFDGESVSLEPSIGNWSFACRSHYWIEHNQVRWARRWSEKEIEAGRAKDRIAKDRAFGGPPPRSSASADTTGRKPKRHLWQRLKQLWRG